MTRPSPAGVARWRRWAPGGGLAARVLPAGLLLPLLLGLWLGAASPAAAQPGAAAEAAPGAAREAPAFASPEGPVPAAADRQRLDRILTEGRMVRREPSPSWTEWIYHLSARLGIWLAGLLAGGLSATRRWGLLWTVLLWSAFTLTLAAVLLWLFRWVRALLGGSGRGDAPGEVRAPAAARPDPRSAGEWRRALDEHLAAGRLEEALEAAWWWLARSLTAGRADPSWTGGELMRRAGRLDLAPAVARFDRLAYGPAPPSGPEIASLVEELDRRLDASRRESAG